VGKYEQVDGWIDEQASELMNGFGR